MQVREQDAGFGRTSDSPVGLLLEYLLFLFFLLGGAWNRIELGLEAAVGDSVVLNLDEVLDVVLVLGAFDLNRTALHLHDSIILDVYLASETLQLGLKSIFAPFIGIKHGRLRRQSFVP